MARIAILPIVRWAFPILALVLVQVCLGQPQAPENRLLSKQDVIAHAKQVFGPGDPFADGNVRQVKLDQIRDFIKARGTDFLPDLDFENKEMPAGMLSVHVKSAIVANYGKHPRPEDYIGKFWMGPSKRGFVAETNEGKKVVVSPEERSRTEPGMLIIEKDGTFIWMLSVFHTPDRWIRGKWREVKPEEMHLWEGGPAIWLEKAHEGRDYMARMCREPYYVRWLEVGEAKARTSMQYGRKD